jgi:cell division protein FtsL
VTPPAAAAAPGVRRARTLTPGRPLTSAPRPRRVSGPARRQRVAPTPRRANPAEDGIVLGALAALNRLSEHTLLDRLIRGRTWIFIVTFALIGIVTLQLGLLKLNASIGRSLERSAALQTENASLSVENSELAAGPRVETAASRLGMEVVPSGALKFLSAGGHGDAQRAARALGTPPNPAATAETSGGEASTSTAASEQTSSSSSSSSETSAGGEASTSSTGTSSASTTTPATGGEAGASAEAAHATSETSAPQSSTSTSTAGASAPVGEETHPAAGTQAAPGGGTQSGPAG